MESDTDLLERTPLPGSYGSMSPTSTHRGPRGVFYFYQVAPDVIYTQACGHMDHGCAEAFMTFVNRTFDRGRPTTLFHDWSKMTGYDSDARATLTRWTIERRASIAAAVILLRSKLVAMGVATANLATSPLGVEFRSHTSREAFAAEFLATTRRRA